MPDNLEKKLYIVLDKIYMLHSQFLLKENFSEYPIRTKHYFEFHNLQELLNTLSINTQPSFFRKVILFKNKFIIKNFNMSLLDDLTSLLLMN